MLKNASAPGAALAGHQGLEDLILSPTTQSAHSIPQYGLPRLIALHLAPGAITAAVYLALTPLAARLHLPLLAVLLAATVVALAPLELGHLVQQGRKLNALWSLKGIVLYRERSRGWHYLWMVPAVCLVCLAGYIISAPLDHLWQQVAFHWLPAKFIFIDVRQLAQFSRPVLIVVAIARLLLDGLLLPPLEELYFRGYLLPRMSRFGWAAPLLNCVLFAVYHFWQPYNLPTLFFVCLPFVFAVWITKDVRLGIYTHVLLNTIGGIAMLVAVIHGV
jgi:membrane protease YdiL (CAAX protease family)